MQKNTAIRVDNLTKKYKLYETPIDRLKESLNPFGKKFHKDFHALENLNFEIRKGETVGIIGRNGSGKSTLLKIITGVLTPTSGRVNIHGKISAILELGAGFNPEMSGLENIYLNTSINGIPEDETKKKIEEILSFAELGDFIKQPMKTYSSGMKARLAFAVSINVNPDILIVDEALSVGDAAFQRKCFSKIEEFRQQGKTILFVSHSENQIMQLCTRAILIDKGKMILDDIPKNTIHNYYKIINSNSNSKDAAEQTDISIQEIHLSKSAFDPTLKPKSTIWYEKNGCQILRAGILNAGDEQINILECDQGYQAFIDVLFEKTLSNVKFGLMIKTTEGFKLGGMAYPSIQDDLQHVEAGTKKRIVWNFSTLLKKGEYFMDAGVSCQEGDNIIFAHRVSDLNMFKVRGLEKQHFTSYINFNVLKGKELSLKN